MTNKLKIFSSAFWKIAALIAVVIFFEFYMAKNNPGESENRKIILGEQSAGNPESRSLSSEDYQIRQLSLGDSAVMDLESEDKASPFIISEIKSGIYSPKNKDETSMILSWKTNKGGMCNIEYYKKGESPSKIVEESDFALSHTAVLSGLDADSVYAYKVKCFDRWGGENASDEYVFYTGAANISFMDILGNAAGKLFGWAIKK